MINITIRLYRFNVRERTSLGEEATLLELFSLFFFTITAYTLLSKNNFDL